MKHSAWRQTVWALLLAASSAPVVAAGDKVVKTIEGSGVLETETFAGLSKWRLLPHLWTEKTVNVSCPGSTDFSVYKADDPEKLAEAVARKQSAWCGLSSVLAWDATHCITHISPFRDTAVAVLHPARRLSPLSGHSQCTFEVEERFSPRRVVSVAMGAFLFLRAGTLVESMAFRLGTGTGGFVLLSAVILAFIIYRSVPNKKSMAAGIALFGTTIASVTRYLLGHWLPSLHDVLYNRWLAAYLALSGMVGLAATYYYDDPGNTKLNTILQRGLQLIGLALVATAPSLPEAGAAAVALLFAAHVGGASSWLPGLKRFLSSGAKAEAGNSMAPNIFPSIIHSPGRHIEPRPSECSESEIPEGSSSQSDDVDRDESEAPADSTQEGSELYPSNGIRQSDRRSDSQTGAVHAHQRRSCQSASARLRPSLSGQQAMQSPQTPVSPLIQRGLIYNEESGRTIQLGKPTYTRLINSGYQVNEQEGTLTPPPATGNANGSGSGGSGHKPYGRSSGGRPAATPGSTQSGPAAQRGRGAMSAALSEAAQMELPGSSGGKRGPASPSRFRGRT